MTSRYTELQYPFQNPVLAPILGVLAGAATVGAFLVDAGLWVAVVAFLLALVWPSLRIAVDDDGVQVAVVPFRARRIRFDEITDVEVIDTYLPFRDWFGGWGYRRWPGKIGYLVGSRHAVALHLGDRLVMITMRDPQAFTRALGTSVPAAGRPAR